MTTFLAIAMLVIGTAATLAAFGGETCQKGPQALSQRITFRGWISLACLALSLILGATMEVLNQRADKKKDDAATAAKLVADAETAAAKAREELSNQRLADLKTLNGFLQKSLERNQNTIDDVRGNLKQARDDLTRANTSGLVSAFANADLEVIQVTFYLPLPGAARRAQSAGIPHDPPDPVRAASRFLRRR